MSARNKSTLTYLILLTLIIIIVLPFVALSAVTPTSSPLTHTLAHDTLAKQLGWALSNENNCGGYYLDQPFVYPISVEKSNSVAITSNETLFSQRGTSILEGKVTVTREGQQITTNKAYLYRDPTGKLRALDMIGDVNLREPNTLIVGKKGRYNFLTKSKSLIDILYRTTINGRQVAGPNVPEQEIQKERKITDLTAWGKAYEFLQAEPKVYELYRASFSTCPPIHPAWRVKASHIVLNKNTGRGYATNARILVKNIPVFYVPYFSFSIDRQRKSGFLWPIYGGSNQSGPSVYAPFYWNMAPNYDMTITPAVLMKRGVQISDNFRYLNETSYGNINVSMLPHDRLFSIFQHDASQNLAFTHPVNTATQSASVTTAELNRLLNDSATRTGLVWRDESRFNHHWSSNIDFNYASDDYYMKNFGNLNEITQNQLLQEGNLFYQSENWNFTGRVQAYQTLHPIDEPPVQNQYRRFPQLILNGDYPDQPFGLEYFINNEITHFDIRNTPGAPVNQPIGNRLHTQPGVSLPIYLPYFYVNPRFQLALTDYNLYQTAATHTPTSKHRALPIFDIASGLTFDRSINVFGHAFQQTLEPQVYYTYIPYRNQASIPLFDTTVNTLAYDQIFNYNRFTGLDRIGDANQIGVGVTTRLIDQESGLEKVRLGIGDIIYFARRRVTLCNNTSCTDNPFNHSNVQRLSPVSGVLDYHVNPQWKITLNSIWNPVSKQLDNSTISLNYKPDDLHIINLGYNFARGGDVLSGIETNDSRNNLKVTDASFAWPAFHDISVVLRWSQNWNQRHLQNLLYGLQYDTCCWAVRLVGGRAFTNLDTQNNNKPQYSSDFYIQFDLKGLGNVGRDPSGLLGSITNYNTKFGQEM
jgi:LPS-assembly protein